MLAGDQLGSAQAMLDETDGATEARRLREVREQAGTRIVVFPDVAALDVARARVEVASASLHAAQGDYAVAADDAARAVAPLVSQRGERSDVLAETVALGYAVEAEARAHLGERGAARQSADGVRTVLEAQFWTGDRADDPSSDTTAPRSPDTPRMAASLLRGVVRDAEEAGEPATTAAALHAYGRALRLSGDYNGALKALERVVSATGTEPRVLALALTDLSGLALAWPVTRRSPRTRSGRASRRRSRSFQRQDSGSESLLGAATAHAEALASAGRADEAVGLLDPSSVRSALRQTASPARTLWTGPSASWVRCTWGRDGGGGCPGGDPEKMSAGVAGPSGGSRPIRVRPSA